MNRATLVTLALVLALGCAKARGSSDDTEALLNIDRAWSQVASAGKNVDSVLAFWGDDAHVAMAGAPMLNGKAALRDMVKSSFGQPGFHVTWTPEKAVIASSGDLGYTTGNNEFSLPDSSGKVTKIPGRYITVWRKDGSGRWHCVEDYTSPGPSSSPKNT